MSSSVEPKVTIAFDHHSAGYRTDWEEQAELRAREIPLAWTEAHGGFWVMSRHADVSAAAADVERFSSAHGDPQKPWAKGNAVPERPIVLSLNECDPPVHTARRAIEAPFFTPKSLQKMTPIIDRNIDDAIAGFPGAGKADLASDFAMPVAAKSAIVLIGLESEHWRTFMLSAHKSAILPPTHPDFPNEAIAFVQTMLREVLIERAANPRDDILSALATRQINSEPLDLDVQVGMVSALIFGGFGTTMSATLSALLWLDRNPGWREKLIGDDRFLDQFIEEILRVYPPNHGIARTVARDMEMHGQTLRKGDRIYLSWAAANRDPQVFEAPASVKFDRPNSKQHMSFGGGAHRCLGSPLARLEIRHMLRGLLRRVPDFRVIEAGLEYYPSYASHAGLISMPVSFGARTHG